MIKRFYIPKPGSGRVRVYGEIMDYLGSIADELQVTIEPHQKRLPSNLQARVSVLIRELADFCGYSESQMKAIIKQEFYPYEGVEVPGKRRFASVPKATMKLTPDEARAVEAHLYQLGAEIGANLSVPQQEG